MKTKKQLIKHLLLSVLALAWAMNAAAYNFKAENEDGVTIYYDKTSDNTVEVTYNNYRNDNYSGTVRIPETVTYEGVEYIITAIGFSAFEGCSLLEDVVLPTSIESIGVSAFQDCVCLSEITIPNSIVVIKESAFRYSGLASIHIPNSVRTIGASAFWGCASLKDVTLSESIISLGNDVFNFCKNINKITSFITSPPTSSYKFFTSEVLKSATLYVPYGTKGTYESTSGWGFKNIVEMEAPTDGYNMTMEQGMQTFCCSQTLDFSGSGTPKAYIASGFNSTTGEVLLSRIDIVPAGTGVLLRGQAGQTYIIPQAETDFVYSNLLTGVLEETTPAEGYVLQGSLFVAAEGAQTVKAGEAYLNLPSNGAKALKLKFVDTTSDIDGIHYQSNAKDAWYTLQGTRLTTKPAQRGIYLNGGRKVYVQ